MSSSSAASAPRTWNPRKKISLQGAISCRLGNMPNLRDRLDKYLRETSGPETSSFELLATVRSRIHHAFDQAQKALERHGYFLAVVQNSSMISAKLYNRTTERDFGKKVEELIREEGFLINLQLAASDSKGLTVYSVRHGGGSAPIVCSKNATEIEDAVYAEIEAQIKAGLEFWEQKSAQ
jgi:hypothetical protein